VAHHSRKPVCVLCVKVSLNPDNVALLPDKLGVAASASGVCAKNLFVWSTTQLAGTVTGL
jgi:hypothetical protein